MADDMQRWASIALEMQRKQANSPHLYNQYLQDLDRAKRDRSFVEEIGERAQWGKTQTGAMGPFTDLGLVGLGLSPLLGAPPIAAGAAALGFGALAIPRLVEAAKRKTQGLPYGQMAGFAGLDILGLGGAKRLAQGGRAAARAAKGIPGMPGITDPAAVMQRAEGITGLPPGVVGRPITEAGGGRDIRLPRDPTNAAQQAEYDAAVQAAAQPTTTPGGGITQPPQGEPSAQGFTAWMRNIFNRGEAPTGPLQQRYVQPQQGAQSILGPEVPPGQLPRLPGQAGRALETPQPRLPGLQPLRQTAGAAGRAAARLIPQGPGALRLPTGAAGGPESARKLAREQMGALFERPLPEPLPQDPRLWQDEGGRWRRAENVNPEEGRPGHVPSVPPGPVRSPLLDEVVPIGERPVPPGAAFAKAEQPVLPFGRFGPQTSFEAQRNMEAFQPSLAFPGGPSFQRTAQQEAAWTPRDIRTGQQQLPFKAPGRRSTEQWPSPVAVKRNRDRVVRLLEALKGRRVLDATQRAQLEDLFETSAVRYQDEEWIAEILQNYPNIQKQVPPIQRQRTLRGIDPTTGFSTGEYLGGPAGGGAARPFAQAPRARKPVDIGTPKGEEVFAGGYPEGPRPRVRTHPIPDDPDVRAQQARKVRDPRGPEGKAIPLGFRSEATDFALHNYADMIVRQSILPRMMLSIVRNRFPMQSAELFKYNPLQHMDELEKTWTNNIRGQKVQLRELIRLAMYPKTKVGQALLKKLPGGRDTRYFLGLAEEADTRSVVEGNLPEWRDLQMAAYGKAGHGDYHQAVDMEALAGNRDIASRLTATNKRDMLDAMLPHPVIYEEELVEILQGMDGVSIRKIIENQTTRYLHDMTAVSIARTARSKEVKAMSPLEYQKYITDKMGKELSAKGELRRALDRDADERAIAAAHLVERSPGPDPAQLWGVDSLEAWADMTRGEMVPRAQMLDAIRTQAGKVIDIERQTPGTPVYRALFDSDEIGVVLDQAITNATRGGPIDSQTLALLGTFLGTGIRLNELLKIRVGHINFVDGLIELQGTGKGVQRGGTAADRLNIASGKVVIAPLPEIVAGFLAHTLTSSKYVEPGTRLRVGGDVPFLKRTDFVFGKINPVTGEMNRSEAMSPYAVRKRLSTLALRAVGPEGVKKITPQGLRRLSATIMHSKGASIGQTDLYLRHTIPGKKGFEKWDLDSMGADADWDRYLAFNDYIAGGAKPTKGSALTASKMVQEGGNLGAEVRIDPKTGLEYRVHPGVAGGESQAFLPDPLQRYANHAEATKVHRLAHPKLAEQIDFLHESYDEVKFRRDVFPELEARDMDPQASRLLHTQPTTAQPTQMARYLPDPQTGEKVAHTIQMGGAEAPRVVGEVILQSSVLGRRLLQAIGPVKEMMGRSVVQRIHQGSLHNLRQTIKEQRSFRHPETLTITENSSPQARRLAGLYDQASDGAEAMARRFDELLREEAGDPIAAFKRLEPPDNPMGPFLRAKLNEILKDTTKMVEEGLPPTEGFRYGIPGGIAPPDVKFIPKVGEEAIVGARTRWGGEETVKDYQGGRNFEWVNEEQVRVYDKEMEWIVASASDDSRTFALDSLLNGLAFGMRNNVITHQQALDLLTPGGPGDRLRNLILVGYIVPTELLWKAKRLKQHFPDFFGQTRSMAARTEAHERAVARKAGRPYMAPEAWEDPGELHARFLGLPATKGVSPVPIAGERMPGRGVEDVQISMGGEGLAYAAGQLRHQANWTLIDVMHFMGGRTYRPTWSSLEEMGRQPAALTARMQEGMALDSPAAAYSVNVRRQNRMLQEEKRPFLRAAVTLIERVDEIEKDLAAWQATQMQGRRKLYLEP